MVLTFFIAIFVLLMQFLWLFIDELVGKGLEWSVIGEFLFWASITLVPMALPLSTLLASIMTMGNMGENNELLALKSAGISLQRIMMPLFVLVFAISAMAFYISNNILPMANLKIVTMRHDIQRKRPDVMLSPGVFTNDMPGYSLRIGSKDPKTNRLKSVMIYDHTMHSGNLSVTIADSGYISGTKDGKYMIVTLYNGNTYQDERDNRTVASNYPFSHRQFSQQEFLVPIPDWDRVDENAYKGSYSMMLDAASLSKEIDSLQVVQNTSARAAVNNFLYASTSFSNVVELDTAKINIQRHVKAVNTDSLFKSYSKEQKARAVQEAISKADAAKSQIRFTDDSMGLESQRKRIAQNETEWHMKFTLSAACLIFFFIGAPLGAIIRKGGLGMPMVLSLILFLFYWVMFSMGKKMAIQGSWNSTIAMWLPSIILLPLGIFLTYKSTTDSALFNADKYIDFFKKIFFIKKTKRSTIDEIVVEHALTDNDKTLSPVRVVQSVSNLSRSCESVINTHIIQSLDYDLINAAFYWLIDSKGWLIDLKQEYDGMLRSLSALEYNKKQISSILREYPQLKPKKYIYHKVEIYINIILALFIPWALYLYLRIVFKRKQLRGILKDIISINRKIEHHILNSNNE